MKPPNKHEKQHQQKKKHHLRVKVENVYHRRRGGVKFLTKKIVLRVSFPVESSLEMFTTVGGR